MRCSRNLPRCCCEGNAVRVTLELDPSEVRSGSSYVVWVVGDNATHASKVDGLSATCSVPEGVFINGDSLKLEVMPAPDPEGTGIFLDADPASEGRDLRGENAPRITRSRARRSLAVGNR